MEIITYPHPTLRYKSKPIKRVDAQLHDVVREMFELMYDANGVGLAANQVDLPIRLFVVNLEADPEKGEELVFINPVIRMPKGTKEHEEGCLSLPGLYGNVSSLNSLIFEELLFYNFCFSSLYGKVGLSKGNFLFSGITILSDKITGISCKH